MRGPTIRFDDCPMPRHFAILARFTEANLLLYTGGTNASPTFSDDDDDGKGGGDGEDGGGEDSSRKGRRSRRTR